MSRAFLARLFLVFLTGSLIAYGQTDEEYSFELPTDLNLPPSHRQALQYWETDFHHVLHLAKTQSAQTPESRAALDTIYRLITARRSSLGSLSELIGRWSVRSLQATPHAAVRYLPYTLCIEKKGDAYYLDKSTGSVRRHGILQTVNAQCAVFIGATYYVSDNEKPVYSGLQSASTSERDAVGLLYRLSADRLILVFPDIHNTGIELYEIGKTRTRNKKSKAGTFLR